MHPDRPPQNPDSRQKMADIVDCPGFSAPFLFDEPELPPVPLMYRLLQGPHVQDGDLCDVLPGREAIILVSPTGDQLLMQNEGRVTFHVPAGWRLLVGSKPLRCEQPIKRFVKMGDSVEELEGVQSVLQLENIPHLYSEASPFAPPK